MFPRDKYSKLKGAYDFGQYYDGICSIKNIYPLPVVKTNLFQGVIDLNLDIFRYADWEPFCESLAINKNLRYLIFKSASFEGNLIKCRKSCLAQFKNILIYFIDSLSALLSITENLYFLELKNIHLKERNIATLSEGLYTSKNLVHLSLDGCKMGDENFSRLITSLKSINSLLTLNVSNNNLTSIAGKFVGELFKFQAIQRHSEAWKGSLRQNATQFDELTGLLRISLNQNPEFGDEGCDYLMEALIDNVWVEAIDLQNCGVSERGAISWSNFMRGKLRVSEHSLGSSNFLPNKTLIVLDLRRNYDIERDTLISLTEIIVKNSKHRSPHFRWLNFDARKSSSTRVNTSEIIDHWPGLINVTRRTSRINDSQDTLELRGSCSGNVGSNISIHRIKQPFKPVGGSFKHKYVGSTFVTPEKKTKCEERKPPTPIVKRRSKSANINKPSMELGGDAYDRNCIDNRMRLITNEIDILTLQLSGENAQVDVKTFERLRKAIYKFSLIGNEDLEEQLSSMEEKVKIDRTAKLTEEEP